MEPKYPFEGRYEKKYGFICYPHDGVAFPHSNSARLMRDIENFECREDDVFVVGYPKSGTNWLQAMIQKLYDDEWGTLKITGGVVPHIDIGSGSGVSGYEYCENAKSPRLMKAHAHYRHMPLRLREQKLGKVLYVSRNPKDICDSFYNQMDFVREPQGFTPDWDEWLDRFIRGDVPFGSWLHHVIEWHAHANDPNVITMRYEDLRKDEFAILRKVTDFIGRPVEDEKIREAIASTEFAKMQEGAGAALYNGPVARRSGKVGGWREHFSQEQTERFDKAIGDALTAAGLQFDFG